MAAISTTHSRSTPALTATAGMLALTALSVLSCRSAVDRIGAARVIELERTPQRVERGRYLADHLAACIDCHSPRDWTRFSGPPIAGREYSGGDNLAPMLGRKGVIHAPNLTPTALATWSDGELIRAITLGVGHDGRRLRAFMPYRDYALLPEDDVLSIVAYLRTLPERAGAVPSTRLGWLVDWATRRRPPGLAGPEPWPNDLQDRGRRLARIAGCVNCHSPWRLGALRERRLLSGGTALEIAGAEPLPPPDLRAGSGGRLAAVDRDTFVARFTPGRLATHDTRFANAAERSLDEAGGSRPTRRSTPMPWRVYSGIDPDDLGAIFDYLRSLPGSAASR